MTPIVTRELVQRYLVATGQITDELRAFDALPPPTRYPDGSTYDDALEDFMREFSSIDRVVLGMLAAAEMLRSRLRGLNPADPGDQGAHDMAIEFIDEAIEAAGVDPEAWENARSQ
jgi:hypothetical protein